MDQILTAALTLAGVTLERCRAAAQAVVQTASAADARSAALAGLG